ncbi:MAG: ABC transporter ATP-binding protein [Eubacterium sp.]|nr:ABC transporter ATP-binding protein [Eubacterium sp.]
MTKRIKIEAEEAVTRQAKQKTAVLEAAHLSVSFQTPQGEVQAVRDVSFCLYPGEVLAVVGESGCGKSVMCKSILKLLPAYANIQSDSICMNGTEISGYGEREMCRLRGKAAAMIFQDPMDSLNPSVAIGAQIAEAARVHQPALSRKSVQQQVERLLCMVGIDHPTERKKQYPHQVSGGMLQRIVLAAALAQNPQILFADEPTTALDATAQASLLDLLDEVRQRLGMAVVFVTHDLGAAARLADRVAVMYAGKIIEIGTAQEIYHDPKHPYTWGLLRSLPVFSRGKAFLPVIPGMPPSLLHPPKGDAFACRNAYALGIDYEIEPPVFAVSATHQASTWLLDKRAPKSAVLPIQEEGQHRQKGIMLEEKRHRKKELILDVQHLSHHFPLSKKTAVQAVCDVSFQIYRGEAFGLVGASGSGKSTVARCVMNLCTPKSGRVFYKGIDSCDAKAFRRHRRMMQQTRQMIFQDTAASLNPRMKVCEIITEPMKIHRISPKRGSYRAEAAFQMKYTGLDEQYLDAYPSALSGGQRQRVAIARALTMEPELLVADEPVASLDVSMQAQIVNLFKHLQQEHGFSFLFIAHDLAVVEFLCDRVGVMYRGRLVECAPVKELFAQPLHPYTKSLLSAAPIPDPEKERARKRRGFREEAFGCDGIWTQAAPEHFVLQGRQNTGKHEGASNAGGM